MYFVHTGLGFFHTYLVQYPGKCLSMNFLLWSEDYIYIIFLCPHCSALTPGSVLPGEEVLEVEREMRKCMCVCNTYRECK